MNNLRIEAVDPLSPAARSLIAQLDSYQAGLYPAESNHLDPVEELAQSHVRFLGAVESDRLLGCGAVKLFAEYGELKRMYVVPDARGKGVGRHLLAALEATALEAGVACLRLETGIHQAEALQLYATSGYGEITPFGDYVEDPLSVFLEKRLS